VAQAPVVRNSCCASTATNVPNPNAHEKTSAQTKSAALETNVFFVPFLALFFARLSAEAVENIFQRFFSFSLDEFDEFTL